MDDIQDELDGMLFGNDANVQESSTILSTTTATTSTEKSILREVGERLKPAPKSFQPR